MTKMSICNFCKGEIGRRERTVPDNPDTGGVLHKTALDCAEDLKARLDAALLQVSEYRKMLWWCARKEGLALHIPKAELESIPEGAELLCWYEKLFDSMILKGICSPTGQGEAVVEKPRGEA